LYLNNVINKYFDRSNLNINLRRVLLLISVSFFTFTLFDFLFFGWYVQWNGGPVSFTQQIIGLLFLILLRTITVEFTIIKLLGVPFRKVNFLLSLMIFGLPLLIIQLSTGMHLVLNLLSPFIQRTFQGAVIAFVTLFLLLDFSRLLVIYSLRWKLLSQQQRLTVDENSPSM